MTTGEVLVLRSSVKVMIQELENPEGDEHKKLDALRRELEAMKRLIESTLKHEH